MTKQPPPPTGPWMHGPQAVPQPPRPGRRGETLARLAEYVAIGIVGSIIGAVIGFVIGYHDAVDDCSMDGWCELGGLVVGAIAGLTGAGVGAVLTMATWAVARARWDDRRARPAPRAARTEEF